MSQGRNPFLSRVPDFGAVPYLTHTKQAELERNGGKCQTKPEDKDEGNAQQIMNTLRKEKKVGEKIKLGISRFC